MMALHTLEFIACYLKARRLAILQKFDVNLPALGFGPELSFNEIECSSTWKKVIVLEVSHQLS